jgi:small subunit ribosomal protein S21
MLIPNTKRTNLPEIRISEGESFESMLRRFTKRVQQEGILSESRRRQHFEPPTNLRKKKAAGKRRKSLKAQRKNM